MILIFHVIQFRKIHEPTIATGLLHHDDKLHKWLPALASKIRMQKLAMPQRLSLLVHQHNGDFSAAFLRMTNDNMCSAS